MVKRFRPPAEPTPAKAAKAKAKQGLYFEEEAVAFIPTGCTLMDCQIGGGWPFGRVVNIVGDRSVGKTLLAIEAAANCAHTFPKSKIWMRETEAAFDLPYANSIGMPVQKVDFGKKGIDTQWETIEDIYEDLEEQLKKVEDQEEQNGGLYILDSLDALSSRAALKRKVGEGSYNLEKVKTLTDMFQTLTRRLKQAKICLMIISQVRENIGAFMGEKYTRTGGKAFGHYSSVDVWLAHIGQEKQTIRGVERVTGVKVRANCKKNKVGGAAFRKVDFILRFGFGVDDLESNVNWLLDVGRLGELLDLPKGGKDMSAKELQAKARKYIATVDALDGLEYKAELDEVSKVVRANWEAVERSFAPRHRKYGDDIIHENLSEQSVEP